MQVTEKRPAFTSDTLMGELMNWNLQEQSFKKIFSEEAIKDKDFQKMKLREYTRISYRHSGTVRTTDEKALFNMLRFQQRKMEKALFPGVLRRLVNRLWRNAVCAISSKSMVEPCTTKISFTESSIVPSDRLDGEGKETSECGRDFKKVHGYDLGARVKPDKEQGKSQGL